MKQVIYVDVLIFVNLIVNYFLILATAKFLYLKVSPLRLIFGEILGSAYSLYIFLPDLPVALALLVRLFMAATIVLVTFGAKSFKIFAKAIVYFFLVSFAFSGIMFGLWYMFRPTGMAVNNGVVYFNISPLVLVISSVFSYLIIEIAGKVLEKRENKNLFCDVFARVGEEDFSFFAKVDTCNYLTEPFSSLPVIVASGEVFHGLFPEGFSVLDSRALEAAGGSNLKLRFIPFKSVSGEGLLPAFKPDSVKIGREGSEKEAYIAVCERRVLPPGVSGLVSPLLLD